ncbi:UPF0746 protein DDB_G0281095-like [Rhipicephalus sanguineus]|uniref:UPF0746 protein DDB_G0281095-like n=1 Tax=Rhipicephalus sanguineus TaxID=34632 RepID=UPI0020C26168|nr:UPF0746 protein DDB_G0281095-like [Rhipicephalus sanguineus]
MPWNVNENDILDFEEDLQQYISYGGSSPIENYIDRFSSLSSLLSFGGAAEPLGTNPPTNAQRFQWQDEHCQREQTERQQQQERPQIGQREQEQQQAERQAPRQRDRQQQQLQRQQRQQQQPFLLQQQRSIFGYPRARRQEQSAPARAAVNNENDDAEQELRAGQGRSQPRR